MTIVLGFLQLFLNVFIIFFEYKRKSISIFLWATLLLMFSFSHFMSVAFSVMDYPIWVYNEASLFVIIFDTLYLVTRLVCKNQKGIDINFQSRKKFNIISKPDKYIANLLWVLLVVIVIMVMYNSYKATGSILSSSWGALLNYSREQDYLNTNRLLDPFFYPASALLFVCKFYKPWNKYLKFVVLLLIFNVVVTRNRIEVLPLVCFVIILFLMNKKLTIKSAVYYVLGGFLVLYIVYGLQSFRYYGSIDDFLENASFNSLNNEIFDRILSQEGELGLRKAFYYFIYNDNNFEGFGEGHTYIRMLLFWLPTEWSEGIKPADFAIAMGKAWEPNSWGYSMHPTLYGDCYANFGIYGVLMGVFWAMFVFISDAISSKSNTIMQYVCVMSFACSYVVVGRGSVYNSFILLVYGLIILFFIYNVLKRILRYDY